MCRVNANGGDNWNALASNCPKRPIRRSNGTERDVRSNLGYDLDVAKSVAKWLVDNGRVPDELNQLLATIQDKI